MINCKFAERNLDKYEEIFYLVSVIRICVFC